MGYDVDTMRGGLRNEWEFFYSGEALEKAAFLQMQKRQSRVDWWKEKQKELMDQVREGGIEISESMAANYSNTQGLKGPQVVVKADLQTKLNECHTKIQEHSRAVESYSGWVQMLEVNKTAVLKLTHADWLYFFGK